MSESTTYSGRPRNLNTLGRPRSWPWDAGRFSSQCVEFGRSVVAREGETWALPEEAEMPDDALLQAAEEEGHFEFLEDSSEDIYSWDDGEEV